MRDWGCCGRAWRRSRRPEPGWTSHVGSRRSPKLLCARQPSEGLAVVEDALAVVDATKECIFAARLHGLKAELLIQQGYPLQAETCLQESRVIARGQQAKTWELRAAVGLARLWREQSRRRDAYELLAPVYGWFAEGFDTPDLRKAAALLKELG